jgi:AcrR family transcriptional regulator
MTTLRTQRKQTTRAALIHAAEQLFEKRGTEGTTLEEVAASAGLHVQTLYRHFSSKQELAAAIDQHYLERFKLELESRDRTQHIFAFWRDWIDRASREVTRRGSERHRLALRRFWSNTTSSSGSSFLRISHHYEELLTGEIAADFGVDPDVDPVPRLVACMLWAANVNAANRWAMSNTTRSLNEVCLQVVDDVTALFERRLKRPAKRPRRGPKPS